MKKRFPAAKGGDIDRCKPSRFVFVIAAFLAASAAPAQVLLVGAGDPAIDVPAVVDGNDVVLLEGTFAFSPGAPVPAVTIRRSVWIAGTPDEQGQIPRILGGTQPFVVAAPGPFGGLAGVSAGAPRGLNR